MPLINLGYATVQCIVPLPAFAVLLVSGVADVHATGVLIIACCPCEPLSNMFTYLSGGDLPLSVAMTTASTAMATGMLPGNLWLYGRYFETTDLFIPYKKMAISILIAISPVCMGMIIRWKAPRIAKWITKIGVYTGLLFILGNTAFIIVIFPDMFTSISPRVYVIILLLPFLGLTLGYGFATLFRQKVPVCKTVAIECGIQNIPLSVSIISLSFSVEVQKDIIVLPHLYLFGIVIGCTTLIGGYQLHKRFTQRKPTRAIRLPNNKEGNTEDLEKEDLMMTKDQAIKLECRIFSSNENYPSRQRNMPI
ncbi:hypothetical protein JTE90_027781 [Oedothorax gibbosus]|uniref:Ileal sodium/bile acid cotransporter n=1 Tax=Oedothorax gibbosus TaxID=931172 RepID=A0AAV6V939_9ARAC|nr:hypothetical protein JTE90_027781 [Oedothorax gibbosus]